MMSRRLLDSATFRFMRGSLGITGEDRGTEEQLVKVLLRTIDQSEMDAAVVLAFDAVHDEDGKPDWDRTHLFVTNDYVAELARQHRQILFGASIYPYRKDAVQELERCVQSGAVLVKWLPLTRLIETIGEAAYQVTDEGRARCPELPWDIITGMRHRIVHAYFDIKNDILWKTIKQSLPELAGHLLQTSQNWE